MLGFENLATFKHFVEKLKDVLATISYVDELDSNNLKKTDTYDLITSDKTVIGSMNELGYYIVNNLNHIGDLTTLSTTNKESLVGSINELYYYILENFLHIGDLTALSTTNKEDLVSSINEVNTVIDIDYDALMQSINEIDASLPDNA